jgi:hypothetical protein
MRSVPAVVLIALSALAGGRSWAAPPPPVTVPSPPKAAPPTPAGSPSSADNEAAARHARRTTCIDQARAKKLVGAQKTAYIKGCIGTP